MASIYIDRWLHYTVTTMDRFHCIIIDEVHVTVALSLDHTHVPCHPLSE